MAVTARMPLLSARACGSKTSKIFQQCRLTQIDLNNGRKVVVVVVVVMAVKI